MQIFCSHKSLFPGMSNFLIRFDPVAWFNFSYSKHFYTFRSSRPDVFCKNDVLKNFNFNLKNLKLIISCFLPISKLLLSFSKAATHVVSIRSSHWRCSVKKCVLKNFAKSRGKQLCRRLFSWSFLNSQSDYLYSFLYCILFLYCPNQGPPRYIETNVLTSCFYLI